MGEENASRPGQWFMEEVHGVHTGKNGYGKRSLTIVPLGAQPRNCQMDETTRREGSSACVGERYQKSEDSNIGT
jgi:hypothetical protein